MREAQFAGFWGTKTPLFVNLTDFPAPLAPQCVCPKIRPHCEKDGWCYPDAYSPTRMAYNPFTKDASKCAWCDGSYAKEVEHPFYEKAPQKLGRRLAAATRRALSELPDAHAHLWAAWEYGLLTTEFALCELRKAMAASRTGKRYHDGDATAAHWEALQEASPGIQDVVPGWPKLQEP